MEDENGQIMFSDAPSPLDAGRASLLGRDSIMSDTEAGDERKGPTLDGFFFDEVSNIRVLDTTKNTETCQLRDECKEFTNREYCRPRLSSWCGAVALARLAPGRFFWGGGGKGF